MRDLLKSLAAALVLTVTLTLLGVLAFMHQHPTAHAQTTPATVVGTVSYTNTPDYAFWACRQAELLWWDAPQEASPIRTQTLMTGLFPNADAQSLTTLTPSCLAGVQAADSI